MIDTLFETLGEADLQEAVANALPEGKRLEYKETLPGNSDADKKEFLADVSAMANSVGGVILYGIAEQRDAAGKTTGLPKSPLTGLAGVNPDAEIRRLEDLLRACLQPRVQGIRFKPIPLANGNTVLALSVPRSWNLPHVVNYQGHWRFYSRGEAGKHPMDVDEVRQAMTLSDTVTQRLHEFRLGRLAQIVAGETPALIETGPKIVLHILPLTMLDIAARLDPMRIIPDHEMDIRPIYYSKGASRINVDGVVAFTNEQGSSAGYMQLFRSGAVEAVDCGLLRAYQFHQGKPSLASVTFEKELIDAVKGYMALLRDLGVNPPVVMALSFLGVKGITLEVGRLRQHFAEKRPIDRDDLILPEILVEDLSVQPATVLRPLFDMVWNACGFGRSFNYDDQGNWNPQRLL